MPQVTPVQAREGVLSDEYVKSAVSSRLASLHFRNQIRVLKEVFPRFQASVEETWPGVQIRELLQEGSKPGDALWLQIRNEDFVADVGTMGHGLQMWVQTVWFLVRSGADSTVILDEPDVYMHADLQRKLIRYLRGKHRQLVIATHSIEIMSEVEPSEILVVERKRKKSSFATTLPAVQRVIETIGSAQNIQLARLWTARRALLLEGKDLKILKAFQDALFPGSPVPLDSLPNMSIGGWGGWSYAIGSSLMIKNALGQEVVCYCILDSDYHTAGTIAHRYKQAAEKGVQLHIWERKEIESYLLVSRALHALLARNSRNGKHLPTEQQIDDKITALAEELRDETFDGLAAELLAETKGLGQGGSNKQAREVLKEKIRVLGLRNVVSGKSLISKLAHWTQHEFGMNLNPQLLARELRAAEIPEEVRSLMHAMERGEPVAIR
jgi:hypothetical protein